MLADGEMGSSAHAMPRDTVCNKVEFRVLLKDHNIMNHLIDACARHTKASLARNLSWILSWRGQKKAVGFLAVTHTTVISIQVCRTAFQ
jgi:hypothetical protein